MWTAFSKTFRTHIRQMLPFHAFALVYMAVVVAIAAWRGLLVSTAFADYIERFTPLYFIVLPATLAAMRALLWLAAGRKRSFGLASLPESLGRLASAALTLAMFILFMGAFTTFKTLMPVLQGGFPYDGLQADLDAFLHGGVDPGPALLGLLRQPLLLQALQWNYSVVWMALTFVPVFFVAVGRAADGIRLRYFVSFACVWVVLGSLIACLFLSAGPIFYAGVTGDTARFGLQMQVLGAHTGRDFEAYLWQNYASGTVGVGTGISAFPSLHVGAAMMNALFLREINRFAGLVGFAYVALIAVSSVLLGWHYAIDGYVSIIVVCLLHSALKRAFDGRRYDALMPLPSPAIP